MTEVAQENAQPEFSIDKVYVKDLSLEIPHAPKIFLDRTPPNIDVQLHTQASPLDEGMYEVVVLTTVTAKIQEKVMFLIEAKQAGIFRMRNIPEADLEQVLAVMCPNILFPFLREVISDVTIRAGFSPVLLNTINFDLLYQQQKQKSGLAASVTSH